MDDSPSSATHSLEYPQCVLAQDAANLLVAVTALHQTASDIEQVAAVFEADQSAAAIDPILRAKSHFLARLDANGADEHVVRNRPGPVAADRHVLPADPLTDEVDVIEHALDRRAWFRRQ